MTSILEKRQSLHKQLSAQHRHNQQLRSRVDRLEPLANLGTASYMIAHEINNLLAPLRTYTELALNHPDDRRLTEKALGKAATAGLRIGEVTESLLALARGETEQKQSIALAPLVDDVFQCLCRDFGKDNISIDIQIEPETTCDVVRVQLHQVIMNLVLNARQAMLDGGGVLSIRARRTGTDVEIEISDTGCGIQPENLDKLFDPFFSRGKHRESPAESSGSGLGLAFCKKAIEANDGRINVTSKPGEGTTFRIKLPAKQSNTS